MRNKNLMIRLAYLLVSGLISGCALSTKDSADPLEEWNRHVQTFNDYLDDYAMKPIAKGYQWVMPSFADRGVTNFFSNINDIGVTINDLLQFKFAQTGRDGARFFINSMVGIGGFVDVAESLDLPKHNEDFDQTLGVWGFPTGPYLVLPFFGSSSPRGIGGMVGDAGMNPMFYLDSGFISTGLFALEGVDLRADHLSDEKIATEAALDRYSFFKSAYFQRREYLVNDGKVSNSQYEMEPE